MLNDEAIEAFAQARDAENPSDPALLSEIFAALTPASVEFMTGQWRGGILASGHPMDETLGKSGWHGKSVISAADVKPLIYRGADGELISYDQLGGASMWMIEYAGISTASMVYDNQPIVDHFKRVDDATVMGIMNGKEAMRSGRLFYFYLVRE